MARACRRNASRAPLVNNSRSVAVTGTVAAVALRTRRDGTRTPPVRRDVPDERCDGAPDASRCRHRRSRRRRGRGRRGRHGRRSRRPLQGPQRACEREADAYSTRPRTTPGICYLQRPQTRGGRQTVSGRRRRPYYYELSGARNNKQATRLTILLFASMPRGVYNTLAILMYIYKHTHTSSSRRPRGRVRNSVT